MINVFLGKKYDSLVYLVDKQPQKHERLSFSCTRKIGWQGHGLRQPFASYTNDNIALTMIFLYFSLSGMIINIFTYAVRKGGENTCAFI